MPLPLEEIIARCSEEYGVPITAQSRRAFHSFLKRYSGAHRHYDYEYRPPRNSSRRIYVDLATDALYLFSILTGEVPVADPAGELIHLTKRSQLGLLSAKGNVKSLWYDDDLHNAWSRRIYHRKYYGRILPTYIELINEVGQDREVVKKWGKEGIDYTRDIRQSPVSLS